MLSLTPKLFALFTPSVAEQLQEQPNYEINCSPFIYFNRLHMTFRGITKIETKMKSGLEDHFGWWCLSQLLLGILLLRLFFEVLQ